MIEKIGVKDIDNNKSFVYKIYLNQLRVFMRINKTLHYNAERYIVIVDTKKFYEAWTGKTVDHCRICDEWELRKYAETIEGFSRGINNPVPLAEVGYSDQISFVDGITRTKWLIINGAPCFPIECKRKSAKVMYQNFSFANTKIENVFRLFKENEVELKK